MVAVLEEAVEEAPVEVEDSSAVSEVRLWDTTKATGGGGRCRAVTEEEIGTAGGTG
ncbi:hypothetical protein [[Eubacterium] cellulosolvens]